MTRAFLVVLAVLACLPAIAQTVTTRDASGRVTGTRQTDSTGTTTIRDAQGRVIGTERTDSTGTTTSRDGRGSVTGTRR